MIKSAEININLNAVSTSSQSRSTNISFVEGVQHWLEGEDSPLARHVSRKLCVLYGLFLTAQLIRALYL